LSPEFKPKLQNQTEESVGFKAIHCKSMDIGFFSPVLSLKIGAIQLNTMI